MRRFLFLLWWKIVWKIIITLNCALNVARCRWCQRCEYGNSEEMWMRMEKLNWLWECVSYSRQTWRKWKAKWMVEIYGEKNREETAGEWQRNRQRWLVSPVTATEDEFVSQMFHYYLNKHFAWASRKYGKLKFISTNNCNRSGDDNEDSDSDSNGSGIADANKCATRALPWE